jgi:cytochrome c oxidase subunit 2
MEGIIDLHHEIMFYVVLIITFVLWMLVRIVVLFGAETLSLPHSNVAHNATLEWAWTLIPAVILVSIAGPSFSLLYSMDELNHPEVTLKVVGHQWYWSYEYSDFLRSNIQSYFGKVLPLGEYPRFAYTAMMVSEDDLMFGQIRLLETDWRVYLPARTHIRVLVTSADVLHSWAIPSLGIKVDACPGRLNRVPVYIKRSGVFYGQCSELCGILHGFMPIAVEVVSYGEYLDFFLLRAYLALAS